MNTDGFSDWLAKQMPPGTIISDARWWAPRIIRRLMPAAPTPEAERRHTWRRRWKGSPPQKGFSIVAEDHLTHPTEIAFLGEVDGDAVDALINAHNAALSLPAAQDGDCKDCMQLIGERDCRDEVIDGILGMVLGENRREWSSLYGFDDALNDVEERMHVLATPNAIRGDKGAEAVMVPREPTQAMVDAGIEEIDYDENEVTDNVRNVWLAMLAAAPTQAAAKEEGDKGAEAVADLPTWLRWVADELIKRDTRGGTFAPGIAQSLRGRAYVLELAPTQAAAKDAG